MKPLPSRDGNGISGALNLGSKRTQCKFAVIAGPHRLAHRGCAFGLQSGGRTESVQDAWPGAAPIPYLRSVADPYDTYSPHHDWGPYELSAEDLASKLGLGSAVESVRVERDDSLRADSVGFAGNTRVKTPYLDRLASEGIVFANAHAHNVVTLPSHVNILTGLYPYQHGVRDNAGFKLDNSRASTKGACMGGPSSGPTSLIRPVSARIVEQVVALLEVTSAQVAPPSTLTWIRSLDASAPCVPLTVNKVSLVTKSLDELPLSVLIAPIVTAAVGALVSMVTARLAVLPTLPARSTTRAW